MRTTSGAVGKCSPILRHYPKIRPKTVQCDGEAIEMESRKIEQPPEAGGHFGGNICRPSDVWWWCRGNSISGGTPDHFRLVFLCDCAWLVELLFTFPQRVALRAAAVGRSVELFLPICLPSASLADVANDSQFVALPGVDRFFHFFHGGDFCCRGAVFHRRQHSGASHAQSTGGK